MAQIHTDRLDLLCSSLAVVVEDASSSCCVTVKVFPHTTVAALKQQVSAGSSHLHITDTKRMCKGVFTARTFDFWTKQFSVYSICTAHNYSQYDTYVLLPSAAVSLFNKAAAENRAGSSFSFKGLNPLHVKEGINLHPCV